MMPRRLGFASTTSVRYSGVTPNMSRIVRSFTLLQALGQFRDRCSQRFGKDSDVAERHVAFAAFDAADVGPVQPGDGREGFLGKPLGQSPFAQALAESGR